MFLPSFRRFAMALATPVLACAPYLIAVAAGAAAPLPADTAERRDWCDERSSHGGRYRHCEVRESVLRPAGTIRVNARPNGGIEVEGAAREDVRVEAKVSAVAETEAEARALADRVQILTDGSLRAEGPARSGESHWSVSFRLSVPARSDLDLRSSNGGISIRNVSGTIAFETTNGGVSLEALSGNVRGRTTNGGVNVHLDGAAWQGEGLDVRTTNGGVSLRVPEGYSAHLETGTINGGLHADFPLKLQGRVDRRLSLDLGGGGAPIRVMTTNGGVRLRRD